MPSSSSRPIAGTGTPSDAPPTPWGRWLLVLGAILLAAIGWFLVFDAWWLNSDGSAYLGLGRSFLHGDGFRLPDGEVLSPFDRPVYPVLLTAPWLVRESFEASIWMSRLPLILAAPLVAAGTLRFTRSLGAGAVAGAIAIAQPWTLLAGGSNLVPDGLTAVAMLGSVLAASVAVAAATKRARVTWMIVALLALLLAALTKQTGAVGLLAVGIVAWNGLARPRRWMILAALATTIPVVVAALAVANGPIETNVVRLPQALADHARREAFAESSWIVLAAIASLLLVAWAVPRATEPLPLAGLALVAPALAIGLYASGAGLGARNAALLPYGVALLAGSLVGSVLGSSRARIAERTAAAAVVVALVLAIVSGSGARAFSASDIAARDWDTAATRGVADFLRVHRDDGTAACTLDYCSYYWLHADGDVDLTLLPQYSARLGPQSVDRLDFNELAGFRGVSHGTPPCTGVPLVVTKSDEGIGVIFECALLNYVRNTEPRYLVVSGSGAADTFDATRLIPYLETNPAFRRVYSTAPSDWPQAVAVYEVENVPQPVPHPPSYYSAKAYAALPGDHGKPGVTVLDGPGYAETIQAILAQYG